MKFDSFVSLLGEQPFFDLSTAVQMSSEDRSNLRTQMYRWMKAGKLLPLRRGMYTLANPYRRALVNPAQLANHLYRPSYLSGLWALGFYGLIPEKVVTYTSVTPRVPRRFENAFGFFEYRNLKQSAFFGYRAAEIQQQKVTIADPEKALLDLWHLDKGSWTEERMLEMRFQHMDLIDLDKLMNYAKQLRSPRLIQAVDVWNRLSEAETEGTVEL